MTTLRFNMQNSLAFTAQAFSVFLSQSYCDLLTLAQETSDNMTGTIHKHSTTWPGCALICRALNMTRCCYSLATVYKQVLPGKLYNDAK